MIYFNEKPPGLTTAEEDSDTWLNLFFIRSKAAKQNWDA